MDKVWTEISVLLVGVLGLAMVAVLVSRQAKTADVIGAASKGFASLIMSATGPVTGSTGNVNPAFNFN